MLGKTIQVGALLLGLLCTMSVAWPVHAADDKAYYDRITLSAQAEAEVDNDTLIVIMAARREGTDIAALSKEINQVMQQALLQCKRVSEVTVQTLGYQTSPVYDKQHITGWRISQSLQLKSQHVQVLSALIGDLQKSLLLESMSYEISHEQRKKNEDLLIGNAIAAFSRRAQEITQHLGRKRYRLVSMQVNTSGARIQPVIMRTLAESEKRASPAITAGKQTLTVTINGVIELVVN